MAAQDWNTNTLRYEVPAYDSSEGKDGLVHMVDDDHGRIKNGDWDGHIAMCGKQPPAQDSGHKWMPSYGFANCPTCLRAYVGSGGKGWFLPEGKMDQFQIDSIDKTLETLKGAHYTDLAIRKDGQDIREQGDWIKKLRKL